VNLKDNAQTQISAFSSRNSLYKLIGEGDFSNQVLKLLLPDGEPFLFEKELWDYKSELPYVIPGYKLSDEEKLLHDCKMGDIIKDVVSLYNTYGGYLVIGVKDKPRELLGYDKQFDCDDLNKRIYAFTKHNIDTHYIIHDLLIDENHIKIGLLYVPQRKDSMSPAQPLCFLQQSVS